MQLLQSKVNTKTLGIGVLQYHACAILCKLVSVHMYACVPALPGRISSYPGGTVSPLDLPAFLPGGFLPVLGGSP